MEQYLDNEKPMAIVMDEYLNGDVCAETQTRRRTMIEYRCCSIEAMNKMQAGVLYNNIPIKSNIATIVSLEEPKVCDYHVLICTPLLCEGLGQLYKNTKLAAKPKKLGNRDVSASSSSASSSSSSSSSLSTTPNNIENESIRSILKRTLGRTCLVLATNDWWAYEYCYGKKLRQFHDEIVADTATGSAQKTTTAEYSLGKYSADLDHPENINELDYLVNVTKDDESTIIGKTKDKSNTIIRTKQSATAAAAAAAKQKKLERGNGAYFVQEYKDGTVCENDKTLIDQTGGIARATTIRYFCGPDKQLISVHEDSTCHYEIDITIPELCEHPLFRAPVMKQRVVKCLPVVSQKKTTTPLDENK